MRRTLTVAAAALLLAVNGWVLLGVARNRLGEPDATLRLRERELVVRRGTGREDSGVELGLRVSHWRPGSPIGRTDGWHPWVPGPKLAALGFDLALPANLQEAFRVAGRQPARRAFAALELGGGAWAGWAAAARAELARLEAEEGAAATKGWAHDQWTGLRRELEEGTRLFMVEVGPDADALRAAYPDRAAVLILPAEVRLDLDTDEGTEVCTPARCRLLGRVSLLTEALQVPRHLQPLLPPAPAAPAASAASTGDEEGDGEDRPRPRFEAVLRAGARREPWIESIRPAGK